MHSFYGTELAAFIPTANSHIVPQKTMFFNFSSGTLKVKRSSFNLQYPFTVKTFSRLH